MTLPSGLWAEGDPLSPTNLNRRNPAGNFPSKTYHVAWAAGTGTTQINNAIANAAAGGYTAVFIDASRLPYDASAVTFNTSVHMYREGGSLSDGCFDVLAYGAARTITSDSYAAFQAAANAQAAQATFSRVYAPRGAYRIDQPVLFGIWGPALWGDGPLATNIRVNFYAGPGFVFQANATFPTATSLATGSGSSYNESSNERFLCLSDSASCDIDGLSTFTAELFVNPTTLTVGSLYQLVGAGATSKPSFRLTVNGTTGAVSCTMTISGTAYSLTGGTLTVGNTNHVACSFDGSTMYLFVAGIKVASAAHAGTITQAVGEEVTVGPDIQTPIGGVSTYNNFIGKRDSIRLSNSCRYTADFTAPTTKFTSDSHTLILCNFDSQRGPLTYAYSASGNIWLYLRGAGGGTSFASIGDLTISCWPGNSSTGVVFGYSTDVYARRLSITDPRVGCMVVSNSNNGEYDYVKIQNATRRALYIGGTSGITQWNSLSLTTFGLFGLQLDGSSAEFINPYLTISGTTMNAVWVGLSSENVVFVGGGISTEGAGTSPNLTAMIHVAAGTRFYGTGFETQTGIPYFARYGNASLIVDGPNFVGGPTTHMKQVTAATTPAIFRSPAAWNPAIPLSDVPGTATMEGFSAGPAVAYSASPTFDCGFRQDFELDASLSGDLTPTFVHMIPQQTVTLLVVQDGSGGHGVTFGVEVHASTAVDTTANHWSLWTWKVGLNGTLYQKSFASGA